MVPGVLILIVGFLAGRLFQHSKSGYHFEIRDEKKFESPLGTFRWRYITESVGTELIDPGTTVLEFEDKTIYKAKRYWQEGVPFAGNIKAKGNSVDWNDGEYRFHLTIEKEDQTADPATGH